jgi:hypothetical protein
MRIQELWMAKSKDELLEEMNRVCMAYPELKSWISNKQKDGVWQDSPVVDLCA